ncbi:hypothetical protein NQ314_013143 [Rhamnusium bicolor]|uniref:Uncharacterized protein n=1 Tax=Rhamnusium bicolor TaxID=1586634 RepID=A0AAV8X8N5_9CUCU|nr:hypothetical protein NQ314_013143 [Rhamnusium bicolor]
MHYKAYQDVINDVISNTREHFVEDGVDETVLQELKQLWQTKLAASKAVEENREADKILGILFTSNTLQLKCSEINLF